MKATRKHGFKKGASGDNPDRIKDKKNTSLRDRATIKRLQMYRGGKAIRNKQGKILGGHLMSRTQSGGKDMARMARVQPDRRWFGNTRVIAPQALDKLREELGAKVKDPYSVVLRQRKLPMSLLTDPTKDKQMHLLGAESFSSVFGPKKTRKRPKLATTDLAAMAAQAASKADSYKEEADTDVVREAGPRDAVRDKLFDKGQSKRIWGELYKVLDSSDVVVQVLDARDPQGTRCRRVEKHLADNAKHKHLIFILNKCDLVPTWVTKKWTTILSAEYPTLAYHASITNPFGKGAVIQLLRQFAKLHSDKKQISVGFIGYPNVGKSSVINSLVKAKSCKVAPIPGETKVWQYITLMRRIYLIDCPGVVPATAETEAEKVLKGVVRPERLEDPTEFAAPILDRVRADHLRAQYNIDGWKDTVDFLELLARRMGKLMPGGDPDVKSVARILIQDWQRGKLPYFVAPPTVPGMGKGAGVGAGVGASASAGAGAGAGAGADGVGTSAEASDGDDSPAVDGDDDDGATSDGSSSCDDYDGPLRPPFAPPPNVFTSSDDEAAADGGDNDDEWERLNM